MRIYSWNINGIRAIAKKGLLDWLGSEKPDILGLQEIKAQLDQLPDNLISPEGYKLFINSAERKGYSGVAVYSNIDPINIEKNLHIEKFNYEGRMLMLEYHNACIFNIYFPNGQRDAERLKYKLDFYDTFLEYAENKRREGKSIIVCGDFNTAHKEIDLFHPKANEKRSGFLPIERKWLDKFISYGYIDTFRHFNREPNNYTWWDYKSRARERNVGWRLDYFFISEDLLPKLKAAKIHNDITGSDHCPVSIDIDI